MLFSFAEIAEIIRLFIVFSPMVSIFLKTKLFEFLLEYIGSKPQLVKKK